MASPLVPVTKTQTLHGNYPLAKRRDGLPSQRGGVPGNRGNPQGQMVIGSDHKGTRLGDAWYLILKANSVIPAPYKLIDSEITECMFNLFPERRGYKIFERVYVMRNAYNNGRFPAQKGVAPDIEGWSWKYVRINVDPEPVAEIPPDEMLPWQVWGCSPKCKPQWRVYPPDHPFRLKEMRGIFKIPKPDFRKYPFPLAAKSLFGRVRKEWLEKERQAFMVFTQQWLAEQQRKRPWDFNPLLWQEPKF